MKQQVNIHKVIFAGAGPGDPELITVKAVRHLREAEVIITDRLVSDVILENYVNPKALVLHAGKQRNKNDSTPQHIINELLVDYALQGKKVLRLKGGDVSLFSNLLDELQALNKYHIGYEIVPGITAASGAAAYAGIPLTARNHAHAVRFLTVHKNEAIEECAWQELAKTNDTLVFYMSGGNISQLVDKLILHDVHPEVHIALIEQATTPFQRVYSGPIHSFRKQHENREYISPTLIIVGRVASLHDSLKWVSESRYTDDLYFKTVTKNKEEEVRA